MKRSTLITLLTLIGVIAFVVVAYMVTSKQHAVALREATSSTPVLRGQALFADGEHGFTLSYPEADFVDYAFASYYHVPSAWRVQALSTASGTPIISITGYRVENTNSYPRYFDAEVRIGTSKDPKELARCLTASSDQNEQPLPDVVINGTTLKAFSFEGVGMMQYVRGVSYRAIHAGSCIALEQIQTGSSYREDPKSPKDIPDTTLQTHYDALDAIIKSFAFVKP